MYNIVHTTSAGNVVEAVRHARTIRREIAMARSLDQAELCGYAKELGVPLELLKKTAELGRLPVVNFAAGGLGRYHLSNLLFSMFDWFTLALWFIV